MTRFPPLPLGDLDPDQLRMAAFAQHTGPYNAFLRAPSLWQALQSVRLYLAQSASLDARTREALMLLIARHWTSTAGFAAHVPLAAKAGLQEAEIAAIGAGRMPDTDDARLRGAFAIAAELLEEHGVADARFAEARATLGERAMVEIVGLIGFFSTTCLMLNLAGLHGDAPFPSATDGYSPADETAAAASRKSPFM